jgi:hypothetical protein
MRAADPTIDLRKCLLTHIDPGLGVAS